jgi:hypothetical protein
MGNLDWLQFLLFKSKSEKQIPHPAKGAGFGMTFLFLRFVEQGCYFMEPTGVAYG